MTQKDVIELYVAAGNDSLGINSVYVLNNSNEIEADKDPSFPALYIVPTDADLGAVQTMYAFNIIVLAGPTGIEAQIDPTGVSTTLPQWDTAIVDAEDQAFGLLHGVLGRVSARNQQEFTITRGATGKSNLKFAGWRTAVTVVFDSPYIDSNFATT